MQAGKIHAALYVVATPIGNLADITLRALETLKSVDLIAAEDTRVTSRLLQHYNINVPLLPLHQHNERRSAQSIVDRLSQGQSVALVSDAGTPAISDPGALAVSTVRDAGYPVIPIPGANAAICALSAAGMIAPRFLFYGFLPAQSGARQRELEGLKALPYTLVFYEAPHRAAASISDIATVFGPERKITIARELTKLFETLYTCPLGEASAWLAADSDRERGEFVLLVDGEQKQESDDEDALRMLKILLDELPLKQAVKLAAQISGAARNMLYDHALQIKQQD